MSSPKKANIKKYVINLKKSKDKYITVDVLSHIVGLYPDVIQDDLSFFDPMIKIDTNFDVLTILPQLEEFIKEEKKIVKKAKPHKKIDKCEKEASQFADVNDFIYRKMSVGGFFDHNALLTDEDLKVLKKLIVEEQQKRKNKKRTNK
jgi:hypothetical protein